MSRVLRALRLGLTRALTALLLLAGVGLGALPAQAHEMTMAEMSLREMATGDFVWAWGVPARGRPIAEELTVHWPDGCVAEGQVVRCGPKGLAGTLSVDGVGKAYSAAIIHLVWRDGERQVLTLTGAHDSVPLFGSARDERSVWEIARTYVVLGVQHILSGFDHLLFVIGLLFLVGFRRRLVGTITAFTVAHSLTLGASALGWLALRPPPVEAMIALSIVLVCAEALRPRETLARRWPALVAFLFGLVHGLGFASALREIGLPEQNLLTALLSFNVGVEAGQLLVVGLVWAAVAGLTRIKGLDMARARQPVLYAMGALASAWSISRIVGVLT